MARGLFEEGPVEFLSYSLNIYMYKIAFVLLIIGGLNWGLVGVFNFDVIKTIFGDMSLIARVVYTLVGLSAIYAIFAKKS